MPYNHTAAVDFLHHQNPPTWTGVELATLGAEGQRQTKHATLTAPKQNWQEKSLQEALDFLQNLPSESSEVLTVDSSDEDVPANYLLEFSLNS
ncbi:hypothetical protein TNCV_1372551 [Trichonephila clavipes]|nr:hypothetical protein TNCV_1372551 [Trichonephila clavipes]